MSTLIRSALVALVLTSASATIASAASVGSNWTDESKQYGGHSPNSPEGNRAFWDYQSRHGN